ncbi:MAG TPA: CRTAC1 family protein, partial [Pyrinomonadaceae bacterium]
FFDYDGDGYLDLYVCNYLQFDSDEKTACTLFENKPYCYIARMKGSQSKLFHNNRDGTFTDVSERAKIALPGKGLGIIAFDYDKDGRIDIFQANDTTANFLFHNNGDGTFAEVALEAGVAYDTNGHARGGMGVDAADIDGDGKEEIFVTNFSSETNALFHNDGDGLYTETTFKQGLGEISIPMSGFGTRFFDYNNDGLIDLFVLNGHPFEPINKLFPETTYAEPPFLFENTGNGFREVAAQHGEAFRRLFPGRGLAVADIDNDGDSDLLLINVGQPPVLLRNDGGNENHWLGIKLIGIKSNRDGIGAWVTVTGGGKTRTKQLLGGTSYCSASDQRLLFGLGPAAKVDDVEIRWPSGLVDRLKNLSVDRYISVKENTTNRDN